MIKTVEIWAHKDILPKGELVVVTRYFLYQYEIRTKQFKNLYTNVNSNFNNKS